MVNSLINQLLPRLFRTYVSQNLLTLNIEKTKNLPKYINNRPEKFIRLIINNLEEAKDYEARPLKISETKYIFKGKKDIQLNLGNDNEYHNCTCAKFRESLICKHFMFLVENNYIKFSEISALYLNHPYNILDHFQYTAVETKLEQPFIKKKNIEQENFEIVSNKSTIKKSIQLLRKS